MQLTRLIYASNRDSIAVEAVDHILQKSRLNNVRDSITGAMVVSEQHFKVGIVGGSASSPKL